jgi:hypothetical protein
MAPRARGLVLRKKLLAENLYERVGMFFTEFGDDVDFEFWEKAKKKTLVIV